MMIQLANRPMWPIIRMTPADSSICHWQVALDRLVMLPVSTVAVFGHDQFMQAMRWWSAAQPAYLDAMRAVRAFDLAHPIANGGGFPTVHDGCVWALA